MKTSQKIILAVGILLVGLIAVILVRTWTFSSKQIAVPSVALEQVDQAQAVRHLSEAVQLQTVSYDDAVKNDTNQFVLLRNSIEAQYPAIQQHLKRTIINNYSLLYEWTGSHPEQKPILLTAHMDVVPANAAEWHVDPFKGEVKDGFIWGRGTLDDKGSLFSILEAVEHLIENGYQPERTLYLGFGDDEEAGTPAGLTGAKMIAEYLKTKGIHPETVLDEGGVIMDGDASLIKGKPIGLIGVAEKGFLTLKITATGPGGHSMMPPNDTTIFLLSRALNAIDHDRFPSSLDGTVSLTFDYLGPEMPFGQKLVFANRWLFGGLIISQLEKTGLTAAMLHTTIAPTVIQGGSKESVLPTSAFALVNLRIMPGQTSQEVIEHVKKSISDPRISVEPYGGVIHEATPLSGLNDKGYVLLAQTIRETYPDVMVAPVLMTGSTDSRYYKDVADDIYRFSPYVYAPGDMNRPHGLNERISIDSYIHMIQFYVRFIRNSSGSASD